MSETIVGIYRATIGAKGIMRNIMGMLCIQYPGSSWHEDKGWFESRFYLRAPREAHESLRMTITKSGLQGEA